MIKETCLFDETVQFNRNYKHCCAASYVVVDLRGVFHAVDSATLQAPYGIPAVPVALPTHILRRCGSRMDSDLRTLFQT